LFLVVIIIAIIIGYLLGGRFKNIDMSKFEGVYLVFIAFTIEAIVVLSIRKGFLVVGSLTYIINLIMYIILFVFIYRNRHSKCMVLIGLGFLLNALPIFLNGGAMPVSGNVINQLGMTQNVSSEGLYVIIDVNTKLSFLADIIAVKYPKTYAASVGDFVEAVGIAVFIITEMKSKKSKINYMKIQQ
jgi:hypothetical protein